MKIRAAGALIVLVMTVGGAGAVLPEAVPDLPVLTTQGRSGSLALGAAPATAPTAKVIDGEIDDWTGAITSFGGTAIYSRGEYVYQDYVMDDRGADDGGDEARVALSDTAIAVEPRAYRAEVLAQALGEQFGADDIENSGYGLPSSVAAPAYYGDASYPPGLDAHADIEEVRIAADADRLSFLVRTSGMTVEPGTAVVIAIHDDGGSYTGSAGNATSMRHELLVIGDAVVARRDGSTTVNCPCPGTAAATNPTGFINAVEVSVDRALLFGSPSAVPRPLAIGVGAGVSNASGTALRPVAPAGAVTNLMNVAFRPDEPQRIWMDHDQALALRAGDIDRFTASVDVPSLLAGRTETFTPRPGYYERVYETDSPVNRESRSSQYWQGAFQHYGLYIPSSYRHGTPSPATWWLHYRGGHAHDAAAWLPGIISQLGERSGNIVISPGARGTSTWYVGRGHEDFLDAWDDAMATLSIDPTRVYLSGYSMGGFASWFLGMVYPDRFAGAFPTAGPPTQGLWAGAGPPAAPQNGGDVEAQLTFNLVENARNLPYVIYHGSNDELVPFAGIARMASRFTELGYRHRLYAFTGAEHYTNAIYDDWTEAARYLNAHRQDPNPPRVTYRSWPAIEYATETVNTPTPLSYSFDGAYWVDDIVVRTVDILASGKPDPADWGTVDAITYGRGLDHTSIVPEAGTGGQATPHAMAGMRWLKTGSIAPQNRFEATLTNVSGVTLDLGRMGIGTAQQIVGAIESDGPAQIRLAGSFAPSVSVSGAVVVSQDAGGLVLSVGSGSSVLLIQP